MVKKAEIILFLVASMMGILGIVFGIAAARTRILEKRKKLRCTSKAKGMVVDIQEEQLLNMAGETPMYTWYPVFRYEIDGHIITKRADTGVPRDKYYVSQGVTILYNPENLNEFYVRENSGIGISGICMIISAAFLFVGLYAGVLLFLLKEGIL